MTTTTERVKKSLRLHPTTLAGIEKTAANLNLNFSRTVEKLIQWGLLHVSDEAADVEIDIQRVVVEQSVSRALNRYLKLLAQTTLAANEAKEMAQQVFFAQLCALSHNLYDAEEVTDALTLHSWKPLHEKLFATYEQRLERGRKRALAQLTQAADLEDDAWAVITKWGKGAENDAVMSQLIEQAVERKLNRHLELLTQTVLASVEAKEMAQQVFFTQLRQLADALKDPIEVRPALALDSRDPLHQALYELYKQRQARGRNRAVRTLKSAIDVDAWQKLLTRIEETAR